MGNGYACGLIGPRRVSSDNLRRLARWTQGIGERIGDLYGIVCPRFGPSYLSLFLFAEFNRRCYRNPASGGHLHALVAPHEPAGVHAAWVLLSLEYTTGLAASCLG